MTIINKQQYTLQVLDLLDTFFSIPGAYEISLFSNSISHIEYDRINLYYHYALYRDSDILLGGSSDGLFEHHILYGNTLPITQELDKKIIYQCVQKNTIMLQDYLLNSLDGIVLNKDNWQKNITNIVGNEMWFYYYAQKSYKQLQELLPAVDVKTKRTKI